MVRIKTNSQEFSVGTSSSSCQQELNSLNFWQQLESKQISKEQVESHLITKLGKPTNQTQTNLWNRKFTAITSLNQSKLILLLTV